MKLWRLLERVNGYLVLTRPSVEIVSRNIQRRRQLSFNSWDSRSNGAEAEWSSLPRALWSPHVFGLVSVGLLLCNGNKGEALKN